MTLRARATKALTWSWMQSGVGAVVQLGTTAAMTRLLVPADFGIVALATVFVRFLTYFSQMGFGVAIVQREVIGPGELRGLSTLSVAIGAAFTGIGQVLACFVAPEVASVLRVLSLSFLISGFTAVPYGLLRRELRNRELALLELTAQVLGLCAVGIALAVLGFGAWSIVGATLAQQSIIAAASWYAASRQDAEIGFARPIAACKGYLAYGIQHSWNTFLEFLFYNVEVLVIGNRFGVQDTGYYNRSYSLSTLPVEQVIGSVVRVLFPILSRVRGNPAKEQQAFTAALLFAGVFASGFSASMYVAAPQIVTVIFGASWAPTIPLIRVFAIAVPFRYLVNLQSAWLDAVGALRPRTITILVCSVVKLVAVGIALRAGAGLPGMLVAIIIPDVLWQAIYIAMLPALAPIRHRVLLTANALFAGVAAVAALGVRLATTAVANLGWSAAPMLAVQVCVGGSIVAAALLIALRRHALGVNPEMLGGLPVVGRLFRTTAGTSAP